VAKDVYVPSANDGGPDAAAQRRVKETSLYDTAIGLYPILLGLILTDSLKNTAEDVVKHPWFKADWSLRFLTVSLLLFSALWLHVWIATFRGMTVRGKPYGYHENGLGHRMEKVEGYTEAVGVFWLGVAQLLVFACMAYSVSHPKEFFVLSAVYGLVLFIYTVFERVDIVYQPGKNPWWHPLDTIKKLRHGRHIPISKAHQDKQIDGDDRELKLLLAQGRVLDTILAVIVIGFSLLLYALSSKFGSTWWIALLALIAATGGVVTDYYFYPYFYLT
jgi:hypothetical protein